MTNPTLDINGRAFWAHNGGNPRALQQRDGEVRFEVRPGDVWPDTPGAERSEVCTQQKFRGLTAEFDILVEGGAKNVAPWCVLSQFHQKGEPSFAIEMKGENRLIVVRNNGKYERLHSEPLVRDRWDWFKVVITEGRIIVIRNRETIVDKAFVGWPGVGGNWKSGIYRATAVETLATRIRYLKVT